MGLVGITALRIATSLASSCTTLPRPVRLANPAAHHQAMLDTMITDKQRLLHHHSPALKMKILVQCVASGD